jgi:hypothetical protein
MYSIMYSCGIRSVDPKDLFSAGRDDTTGPRGGRGQPDNLNTHVFGLELINCCRLISCAKDNPQLGADRFDWVLLE